MTCAELAARIELLQPDALPRDVARMCLLLANAVPDLSTLRDEACLAVAWLHTGWRLQSVADQHAAMTEELERLAQQDAARFSPDQVRVLIRAIKVQSQVLQLYVGHPQVEV